MNRPIRFDHLPLVSSQRPELVAEKINPNTASMGSLRRLGGIGPVKAQAIADYAAVRNGQAFTRAEDLQAVEGMGAGLVERLRPYLTFDSTED